MKKVNRYIKYSSFRYLLLYIIVLFLSVQVTIAQPVAKVKKIRFAGNDSINSEELLNQMNTKSAALSDKLISGEKSREFSGFTLDEDIIRLKKFYQQNGFLNPVISYELTPNKKNSKISISINIKENEPIITDKIEYSMPSRPEFIKLLDSLKNIIPLKTSNRFRDDNVLTTEKILIEGFNNKGFPFVEIIKTIDLHLSEKKADVLFNILPGEKSFFGEIELQGDSLIPRSLIDKNIDIKKSDPFSTIEMEKTRQNLVDLGLFRYVTIRATLDDAENNFIPVTLQLKELPRWSLKTGIGYGTEDKIRISMLLTRLNFLGGARKLIIKGQHSYYNPVNLDAKFIQPSFLGDRNELAVNPYFSKEREESYDVRRVGSAFTLQKELTKTSNAYISYTLGNDYVKIKNEILSGEDQRINELGNNKSGITFGMERNSSNDLFSPSKGSRIKGTATYMGLGFNSKYHYYKFILDAAWYKSLTSKIVLAAKIKGGIIEATQNDLITPIEDRFLMGGATSLRGWGRNQISPINENGNKLGGNTMVESSLELRFPVYGILSATTFIDAGNVWENSWDANLSGILYNAGVGLRVQTPVGPIRLDVANPIFYNGFKPQFFITIGQAF